MQNLDSSLPVVSPEPSTDLVGQYESDVSVLNVHGKTVILVGTAHVSQESVDLVKLVIEQEHQIDGNPWTSKRSSANNNLAH